MDRRLESQRRSQLISESEFSFLAIIWLFSMLLDYYAGFFVVFVLLLKFSSAIHDGQHSVETLA